jgi:hypothetical protein
MNLSRKHWTINIFSSVVQQPLVGQGLLIIEASGSHLGTTLGRTPLDEWSARRRDLYLTTHSTQKDTHPWPSGIQTRNPSRRTAAEPRLRPRGHWNHDICTLLIITLWILSAHALYRIGSPDLFYLPTVGVEVYFHLITFRHTPQSVWLLWTRDRPIAETSTWQHKHCKRDKHPCPRWISNPQSQQAFGRRTTT